ncbi:MAG: hypothetical protein KDA68_18765, partial [Planctomycetaceae bacterium]|nr:hypothetical protein [Planctomycetaceae bacterium]
EQGKGRFISRLCLFFRVEFPVDFHASKGYETGSGVVLLLFASTGKASISSGDRLNENALL